MSKVNPEQGLLSQRLDLRERSRPPRTSSIPMAELLTWTFEDEVPLLGDLITAGSTGMLAAERGLGKSIFALYIAYAIAGGKCCKPWGVGAGAVVVYLDGEMHTRTLAQRLKMITNSDPLEKTRRLAGTNLQIIGRDAMEDVIGHIDVEEDQRRIENMLPADCRMLIIDNLSAWTSSGREDGASFAPIKRWLARLRTVGIAVLLVHHTGKSGRGQRGSSIHEDMLDYFIKLDVDPRGKPANGTRFLVTLEKQRELHADVPEVFGYTFTTDPDEDKMRHLFELTGKKPPTAIDQQIVDMLLEGVAGKDVAITLNVAQAKVSRVKGAQSADTKADIEEARRRRDTLGETRSVALAGKRSNTQSNTRSTQAPRQANRTSKQGALGAAA